MKQETFQPVACIFSLCCFVFLVKIYLHCHY